MKVYIAAPFGARNLAKWARTILDGYGITSTARWLDLHGDEKIDDEGLRTEAYEDLRDIEASDALVLLNDAVLAPLGQGGKHFETGYAIALGKPVFVIGKPTNVFHYICEVITLDTLDQFIKFLKPNATIGPLSSVTK